MNNNNNKRKFDNNNKSKKPFNKSTSTSTSTSNTKPTTTSGTNQFTKKKFDNKRSFSKTNDELQSTTPKILKKQKIDNNNVNNDKKKTKVDTPSTTPVVATVITPIEVAPSSTETPLPPKPTIINSNWNKLAKKIGYNIKKKNNNNSSTTTTTSTTTTSTTSSTGTKQPSIPVTVDIEENEESIKKTIFDLRTSKDTSVTKKIGLDCEMVEVTGNVSALGSICIVNSYGNVIYKSYCKPEEYVTDYRTRYSGLTKFMIDKAPNFKKVQKEVIEIIKDKIVVGHNLETDFKVIGFAYNNKMVRDSFYYPPFLLPGTEENPRKQPQSLKKLTLQYLGVHIQTGRRGHNAEEDALSSMLLYNLHKKDWESFITKVLYIPKKSNDERKAERNQKQLEFQKTRDYYFSSLKK